ncbi:unnamed protein product [Strongylus vulgaris]|uniref:Tyrosine-protein kinase catalytic domain-containing protein n=1 Tax=Strongylus vulgaris TaxID=40348 RepID=A0A3P7LHM1_STRVU|nr:unnamed protein product [Strongylus vulgaris]
MGAELGEGKHTIVRECAAPGIGNIAYKTIKDRHNSHARSALMDEIKMLAIASHPHVVHLLATDENNGLVLELMTNGNNCFSSHSDVWAFAVCCWEITETSCTRIPFETFSNSDLVTNAQLMLSGQEDAVVPLFTESVPRGIRDVFVRCFEVEPPARPLFSHISYFMSKYHASFD